MRIHESHYILHISTSLVATEWMSLLGSYQKHRTGRDIAQTRVMSGIIVLCQRRIQVKYRLRPLDLRA